MTSRLLQWWSIEIRCHPEIVKAALWRMRGPGHRACAVARSGKHVRLWAFLEAEGFAQQDIARLWLGLHLDAAERKLPNPEMTWRKVDTWDWPLPIKRLMVPRDVGCRLTVVPLGTTPRDSNRIPLLLDCRLGFGVGGVHPTTRLCLEALERHMCGGDPRGRSLQLADIGCGCGTLSIAVMLFGGECVYAVDTKAASVRGTKRNRDLNGITPDRMVVEQGSVSLLERMIHGPVDGFMCNILTRIIVHLIPRFGGISGPNTWGILSGIRDAELDLVLHALDEHRWQATGITRLEGWCCVEVARAS